MEKKICLNGHEFDPEVNSVCLVCGQAAVSESAASIFDGFGDDPVNPAENAPSEPASFMEMYGSFDDYDNSTPPPVRTMGGGNSDPLPQSPTPPVRSMKPMPGQPVPPVPPQVQPQQTFQSRPQAVPLNNLNNQPNGYINTPQMIGQMGQMGQSLMQPQAIPQNRRAQSLHNQPNAYMNRPTQAPQQPRPMQMPNSQTGQTVPFGVPLRNTQMPQTTPPPFGVPINTAPAHQQVTPFGAPLQGQTRTDGVVPMPQMPQFGMPPQGADMQTGFEPAGYTRNVSVGGDMIPQNDPIDGNAAETALPVGCLIVLGGNARGEIYNVRMGDNIIGRNGMGVKFAIDLNFNLNVCRAPQAVVTYDVRNRRYTISPAVGAMNAVYINGSGEPLTGTSELNSYDKILIEGTVLLFIGFCGSIFMWDNV